MNSVTIPLGDLAEITSGFAFKSSQFNTSGSGLPLVRIRDVVPGVSETFYSGSYKDEYLVNNGDALIGMDGEFNLGTWCGGPALLNQRVCRVQTRDIRLDQGYLLRFLPQALKAIEDTTPFVTVKHLSVKDLRAITVPLPPLSEQRRIAAVLDKADALRIKRREAIAKLDQLLQSVFLDMFGDLTRNPKGWPKQPLGTLVVVDAPLVDPRDRAYELLLHYGPDRIEKESGRLLEAKTAREDGLISKKFLCDNRHILYSKIRPYLNKVALARGPCLCSADVYPVEPIEGRLTRYFLWHVLRSKDFLDHAATYSNRANIPKLNRDQLLQYQCPVPGIDLQRAFDRFSDVLSLTEASLTRSRLQLDRLFTATQFQAFGA